MKAYNADTWYYFGSCRPFPMQIDGYPNPPFKAFSTYGACLAYILEVQLNKKTI